MAETVNKSDKILKTMRSLTGKSVPIRNHCTTRWTSIHKTMEDVLMYRTELEEAFAEHDRQFPLTEEDYDLLLELYNILYDATMVIQESQRTRDPAQDSTFRNALLQYLRLKNFCNKDVSLVWPRRRVVNEELMGTPTPETIITRSSADMHEITKEARLLAIRGLNIRFFNRYHPYLAVVRPTKFYGRMATTRVFKKADLKFSYVYEISLLLNPKIGESQVKKLFYMVSLNDTYLQKMKRVELIGCRPSYADTKKSKAFFADGVVSYFWNTVTQLVAAYYENNLPEVAELDNRMSVVSGPKRRRICTAMDDYFANSDEEDSDAEDENAIAEAAQDDKPTPLEIAKKEVDSYRKFCKPDLMDPLKVLPSYRNSPGKWSECGTPINAWFVEQAVQVRWPGVMRVALAFVGMPPGSGGLECDIGAISDIVSRKRAKLDPGMVEAIVFVRLNKYLQEFNTSEITALGKRWQEKIPKREFVKDMVTEEWIVAGMEREWEEESGVHHDEVDTGGNFAGSRESEE